MALGREGGGWSGTESRFYCGGRGGWSTAARAARAQLVGVSERASEGHDGSQLNARPPIGGKTKEFHFVQNSAHGLVRSKSVGHFDDGKKDVAGGDAERWR